MVSYWDSSRAPRYSVLFALPLLLLYEAMAAFLPTGHGPELRNGADVLLWEFFLTVAGRQYAPLVFGLTLIGFGVWFVGRDLRGTRAPIRGGYFLGMLGESLLLALCFGSVVGTLTAHLVQATIHPAPAATVVAMIAPPGAGGGALANAPTATRVMLSLGAGLYEELLFRVILVSGIAFIGRRLFGWKPWVAGLVAVLLSAPFTLRRKRVLAVLLTALTLLAAGFLISCGGGSKSSSSTPTPQATARTYIVTVTPMGNPVSPTNPPPVTIAVTVP